jgi:hypothetical protein
MRLSWANRGIVASSTQEPAKAPRWNYDLAIIGLEITRITAIVGSVVFWF